MADMIDPNSNDPRNVAQFKTISFWAVAALIVAVGSIFYLINEQLLAVPILAFILAIVALIRIESVENLSGKWIAIAALTLSAFIFTSVATYKYFRHDHMIQVAKDHADTWLKMVQAGDLYKTHQLTYEYPERRSEEEDLEVYYGQPKVLVAGSKERPIYMELDQYSTVYPEVAIRSDGTDCEIINEGFEHYNTKYKKENFVMRFRLKRADPSLPDEVFLLEMRRTNHYPPMGPRWTCSTIDSIEPRRERKLSKFAPPE